MYPNRIVLRAPIWQRLFFPLLIPCVIYWVASDVSLQTANGYTAGATIALVIFALLEILFLARFFLDGALIVDPEGVSFTKLGKKHFYKWKDISYVFSAPIAGIYPFYNTIHFHEFKHGIRGGITLPEYYGFISGIGLGNFLKAYHKAALEAQGSGKQE